MSSESDAQARAQAQAQALISARQSYAAAVVAVLTYGMYSVLVCICLHYLFKNWRRTTAHYITTGYVILMLLVSIVYFASGCIWSEIEFVESSNPGEFAKLTSNSVLAITKNVAFTVNIFLADSLIVYRTYIVWARRLSIVVVPIIIYLGTLASGIGLLYWSSRPYAEFGQHNFVHFGTAFYSTSISLNVVTTILIAGRLLYHQQQSSRLRASSQYLGLVSICVESALIYSLSGVIYIPLFALNLPQQFSFSALLGGATIIAPTLIVMRIALGVAVKDTHGSASGTHQKSSTAMSGSTRLGAQDITNITNSKTGEPILPTHVFELRKMSTKEVSLVR